MIESECELVPSRERDVKTHNPGDHLMIRKDKERDFHHFCCPDRQREETES